MSTHATAKVWLGSLPCQDQPGLLYVEKKKKRQRVKHRSTPSHLLHFDKDGERLLKPRENICDVINSFKISGKRERETHIETELSLLLFFYRESKGYE